MSVEIKCITEKEIYSINGKEIYKDANNNWVCREELTSAELKEFSSYKAKVIELD